MRACRSLIFASRGATAAAAAAAAGASYAAVAATAAPAAPMPARIAVADVPASAVDAPIVDPATLNRYIDHTILKPDATPAQVAAVAAEAVRCGFASVCVNGAFVRAAREAVDALGGGAFVVAVIGFPLGAASSAVKAFEAGVAIDDGADELDMVVPVGVLKAAAAGADAGAALSYVLRDIAGVVAVAHPRGVPVKVILETSLLTDAERDLGVRLAALAGADFVKTSTGFAGGGATARDVRAMAEAARAVAAAEHTPWLQVKASGGIRTAADALAMLDAGASRLGVSASVAIMAEAARMAEGGGACGGAARGPSGVGAAPVASHPTALTPAQRTSSGAY